MQNNISPGSDGITVEFYKIFWNTIKQHYIRSINYSFEAGSLTELQKQSIITLIPKQNNDITILDNWRPISLLNVDYKMAAKVIANRVKDSITKIIDHSQTGFIKGRYIGENIRLLFEIIDAAEEENKPGLIFFSDFEKAFDSVDHSYMKNCLKNFNFGEDFINGLIYFIVMQKVVLQTMAVCQISSLLNAASARDVHCHHISLLYVLKYGHIKLLPLKISKAYIL